MDTENQFLLDFFRKGIPQTEHLETIGSYFQKKELAKNEYLLKAQKVSTEYLILESGFMRAFSVNPEGTEVTTSFYTAGQPVFDVASFFLQQPSKEYIQALTPCIGWAISFKNLNTLFHSIPEFREFGRSILVSGFANLKLRMQATITETADKRYLNLLQTNPEIFKHVPMKHIASYLGITDSSLSRIRREIGKI